MNVTDVKESLDDLARRYGGYDANISTVEYVVKNADLWLDGVTPSDHADIIEAMARIIDKCDSYWVGAEDQILKIFRKEVPIETVQAWGLSDLLKKSMPYDHNPFYCEWLPPDILKYDERIKALCKANHKDEPYKEIMRHLERYWYFSNLSIRGSRAVIDYVVKYNEKYN